MKPNGKVFRRECVNDHSTILVTCLLVYQKHCFTCLVWLISCCWQRKAALVGAASKWARRCRQMLIMLHGLWVDLAFQNREQVWWQLASCTFASSSPCLWRYSIFLRAHSIIWSLSFPISAFNMAFSSTVLSTCASSFTPSLPTFV